MARFIVFKALCVRSSFKFLMTKYYVLITDYI